MNEFDGLPSHLQRLVPVIGRGLTNAEIADEMGLAKHTVENYVSEIMCSIDCSDRLKLALLAASSDFTRAVGGTRPVSRRRRG